MPEYAKHHRWLYIDTVLPSFPLHLSTAKTSHLPERGALEPF